MRVEEAGVEDGGDFPLRRKKAGRHPSKTPDVKTEGHFLFPGDPLPPLKHAAG